MRDRPDGVADTDIGSALAAGWELRVVSATYRPVGFGSYHWDVVDDGGLARFVTVDDLGADEGARDAAFERLGRALDTALALRRDAGLGFVVAPIPTRTGSTLWRLIAPPEAHAALIAPPEARAALIADRAAEGPRGHRYAISVFPMVEGEAGQFGAHRPQDRAEVIGLLADLHDATPVVAAVAPRTDLTLPGRDSLQDALGDLDRAWAGGPYAEPARRLLAGRADHVGRLLGDFDRLVAEVRDTTADWVVTHGEPHPGNLIRSPTGLRLIDWDTVQVAPPERDLWLVTDGTDDASGTDDVLADYRRATGRPVTPAGLALYRLWWDLADIAIYVEEFRRPHRDTEDTTASWTCLNRYLA